MRVLITGARGMLGQALQRALGSRHELVALSRSDLDVTDLGSTLTIVGQYVPDVVIHAAAWTDVDGCETDPDRAFRVNALGTRNVAAACREGGAACCYISTDYVFDGAQARPYTEFDRPNPLSVYGASKLAGERAVKALVPEHWIVRSAWLFGPGGKNFVRTIVARARAGEKLRVVDDQRGSPTYTDDLALAIGRLIAEPRYGTWHLTNSGACSWYELARSILANVRLSAPIEPIDSAALGRPAPRPAQSALRNYCWELEGWPLLRSWEEALVDYLRHPELG